VTASWRPTAPRGRAGRTHCGAWTVPGGGTARDGGRKVCALAPRHEGDHERDGYRWQQAARSHPRGRRWLNGVAA
jgi:hypothetical protein